ncbi:MAG: 16S rRNA (cytosine(967)-C(5))-methyltransferase [Epulopiscium sp. Nuni2H_MBin003]|nr:MAG: 16S rRNA (cytosine(967)-C(5))-methyltransferase [Epulopiscium sp. Nuni2H_MBin003]
MKTARETIIDILTKVETEQAYLQLVLKNEIDHLSNIDKNFVTEVASGTIKYKITIDYLINSVSKTSKLKPFIRNVLRMSVYQMVFLDKIPARAVINEAVNIVKKRGFTNLSGFVNAVLRNIDRMEIILPNDNLSIKYSMPNWIIDLWKDLYGEEETIKICTALNKRARVCVRINTLKTTKEKLIKELTGINCIDANIYQEYMYLENTNSISKLDAFKNGLFTVQDESAGIVSRVVSPMKNERILDMCSAPGGKATHMAQINESDIVSIDIYEHKIKLIKNNADRLGITCITPICMDATIASFEQKFDKILLDVPCSGLGLLKRKPDIRYTKSIEDIENINLLQKQIARNAIRYLKNSGTLVYSTCTLTKLENYDMVEFFTNELGLVEDDIEPYIPQIFKKYVKGCYVTILPYVADTDGFFIARFRKP